MMEQNRQSKTAMTPKPCTWHTWSCLGWVRWRELPTSRPPRARRSRCLPSRRTLGVDLGRSKSTRTLFCRGEGASWVSTL